MWLDMNNKNQIFDNRYFDFLSREFCFFVLSIFFQHQFFHQNFIKRKYDKKIFENFFIILDLLFENYVKNLIITLKELNFL